MFTTLLKTTLLETPSINQLGKVNNDNNNNNNIDDDIIIDIYPPFKTYKIV